MRRYFTSAAAAVVLVAFQAVGQCKAPPAIETVEIGAGRVFRVNGEPFFPIMSWLQDAKNFEAVKACGMNATAGYWPKSSGTKDVTEYIKLVEAAGLYGVMPFDLRLKGRAALLGYIHGDEPDLPRLVSNAVITPAKNLKINRKTPLWKLLDGSMHSWSVLDPLDGASITIELPKPVTVKSLAIWLTVSKDLAVANEVKFEGDGKDILQAAPAAKKGRQKFLLPEPATFSKLKMTVTATFAAKNVWGSLGEIEGFDENGKNVLLSRPRNVPRTAPEETARQYKAIKTADPSRPIFMTFTGHFHPFFKKYSDAEREIYPRYIKSADVVGYDIYPIYGWNKPQWIHLVHEGTKRLVELAGDKPVYAWIETSRGGQWTGPLAGQKEVTPTHIRAEVWMAICRGATAIGYFTHVWKPAYNQFGVPPKNRKALREINDQITRLAPDILAAAPKPPVTLQASDGVKVDVMARAGPGGMTIFAVNYDERLKQTKAVVKIDRLPAGTEVAVVDENRTVRSQAGSFTDTFAPLAVHIYRIRSASAKTTGDKHDR
ncbi:MAG: hypothetical protein ISS69_14410 [Phycisphaerae bacterium]|nr:hypothetical protein [Phycisphaerae bacterium]